MKESYSFSKEEKLCSKIDIDNLFKSKGKNLASYPFFFNFRMIDSEQKYPLPKLVFLVSKRKFKKAVDRNRVKRMCRELYRLRKPIFLKELELPENKELHLCIGYMPNEILEYTKLQKGYHKALKTLINEIKKPLS